MKKMRGTGPWFVKKDIDGFFGLGLDNLIQFILIGTLCQQVLGMPGELIVRRIFPGAALSILFGNLFYAWQARRLARETGRDDVTALPYGINTVSLLAFIFFVMHPVYLETGDVELTWKVGVLACFLSGVIEFLGAFVAERIRRVTPRAALLSALAGIAMTFISMDFLFRIYQAPTMAVIPMMIILVQYFSNIRYPFGIPGGLLAIGLGTLLYWTLSPPATDPLSLGVEGGAILVAPQPAVGGLLDILRSEHLLRHLSIIIPMGLLNVVGSLQNIESAEAGGDSYSTAASLSANGVGSILASLFGSCFPTTIYIGHPGWKAMGARSGYSLINGVFIAVLCFTGSVSWVIRAIPLEAGIGILLWIGIVICAQAFQVTPRQHAPAVAFGLFPCLAAWGTMMAESGLRAAGSSFAVLRDLPGQGGFFLQGMLSLNQGFLFSAMVFAAMAVYLIEKDFRRASLWALVGAACAYLGLIHAFRITPGGVLPLIGWGAATDYAVNYLLCAGIFMFVHIWRKKRGYLSALE
jgi:AGZA family xanthine/uracil permease-like MFS transporter